jgi:predicted anti-sigma-YlaC factor YlaD
VNLYKQQHLNEQQLIQAVVDESDLPRTVQMHLGDCHRCRSEKDSFEQELAALGQVAERYAPPPQKRIVLPLQEAESPRWSFLNWRHAFGAAAAVAVLVVVFWASTTLRNFTGLPTAGSPSELLEARQLMTEVNMLVDNALPPLYLEISAEYKPDDDKDFYQFLIPQIET